MDILGETFLSKNYGEFKVVGYESSRKVRIKFKNTGYERFVTANHVKTGEVKDKCSHSIYGVACIGDGWHKAKGR